MPYNLVSFCRAARFCRGLGPAFVADCHHGRTQEGEPKRLHTPIGARFLLVAPGVPLVLQNVTPMSCAVPGPALPVPEGPSSPARPSRGFDPPCEGQRREDYRPLPARRAPTMAPHRRSHRREKWLCKGTVENHES